MGHAQHLVTREGTTGETESTERNPHERPSELIQGSCHRDEWKLVLCVLPRESAVKVKGKKALQGRDCSTSCRPPCLDRFGSRVGLPSWVMDAAERGVSE